MNTGTTNAIERIDALLHTCRPQQRLTAEAEQARRDIQHRLQRELSAWPRINAPAA